MHGSVIFPTLQPWQLNGYHTTHPTSPQHLSHSRETPSTDPQQQSPSFYHSVVVKPVSTVCIQPSQVTPLTSVNTLVFSSPKYRSLSPASASHNTAQTTQELDVTPCSPSINNAANLHEFTNIFKGADCNPPASHSTALIPACGVDANYSTSKEAVSTLLSTASSFSHLFQPPRAPTAQSLAFSFPPRKAPDHVTTTMEISVPLTTEQQVSITRTCDSHSRIAYTASMLNIYRVVTPSGLPIVRGSQIPLPSNFIFNDWEAITHSQADREIIH